MSKVKKQSSVILQENYELPRPGKPEPQLAGDAVLVQNTVPNIYDHDDYVDIPADPVFMNSPVLETETVDPPVRNVTFEEVNPVPTVETKKTGLYQFPQDTRGTLTRGMSRTLSGMFGLRLDAPLPDVNPDYNPSIDEGIDANPAAEERDAGWFRRTMTRIPTISFDDKWKNQSFFALKDKEEEEDDSPIEVVDDEESALDFSGTFTRKTTVTKTTSHGKKSKKKKKKKKCKFFWPPIFIVVVSIVNIIYLIAGFWYNEPKGPASWPAGNPWIGPDHTTLVKIGGKFAPKIQQGEVWRFFTAIFIHEGIIHLIINLVFQMTAVLKLEIQYGIFRIGIIYILSGIGGNILSAIFLPDTVEVGSNGALYGCIGVLVSDLIQNWGRIKRPWLEAIKIIIVVVVSLLVGLLPGIDNFCQIGGFIVGMLSGVVFLPTITMGKWQVWWKILLVSISIPLLVLYFAVTLAVFFVNVPANNWCSICSYANCINIFGWCESAIIPANL